MEFAVRTLEFEKCLIKSQIWDTAGQERFEGMSEVYYRDAVGAILVYDICNKESLEDLKTTWLPQVRQYGQSNVLLMLGSFVTFFKNVYLFSLTSFSFSWQ